MSYNLTILQSPLAVTESHSDHTWNVALNEYSAYTDIRLVVDVYRNPYSNDYGTNQLSEKAARLLVPVNVYGNCIFNVETIIRNFVKPNPRNMDMVVGATSGTATMNPYQILAANSQTTAVTGNTSQATIIADRVSTVSFSNGFNGSDGFDPIYHINEYRLIFGIQYTNGSGLTTIEVPTNYSAYTGNTTSSISITDASTQPYGVMIYPGVQENKQLSTKYYFTGTNLNGQYNYLNTEVFNYQLTGSTGRFMSTFSNETIPMTILGSQVYQTRYRTHYYKCPIIVSFMYGKNPLFDNTQTAKAINYLQKTGPNGQYNYDVIDSFPLDYTTGSTFNSYLNQRIAYGIFKPNPTLRTNSDVAIFLSDLNCGVDYDNYGVSEIVQYKMVDEECLNNPMSFLFLNRQGVWDTYTFTKMNDKTYAPQKKVYSQYKSLNTRVWNRQSYDSSETVYYGMAEEIVTAASGYVAQTDADVIEQLIMSPYVYQIQDNWLPQENMASIYPYLIPVTVQNNQVKVYQSKYQRLFQYTMEMKQVPYRPFYLPT
jgi:hypothetical protein